ncbi:MAG: hypothetical protein AAGU76_05785 [Sedimentibacter sp.]|uniref:hypothetical protein n=1 Tax=Sedimentibacter sp. TaxID=1960295 RepID=UPI00315860D0
MKKGDLLWGAALLAWIVMLAVPTSRQSFMAVTGAHPYMGGFIKFMILATMGDLLGTRLVKGKYVIPEGVVYRAIGWGVIGMMVTLMFTLFMDGAGAAQSKGLLPFAGSRIAQAFFGSAVMNLTFGPMMMVFHKFMDLFIDAKYESKRKITLSSLVDRLDWHTLVQFSWAKTCTMFWIPAHTVVFMLPSEIRVLVSAFLSIALGLLLAFAKKEKPAKSS